MIKKIVAGSIFTFALFSLFSGIVSASEQVRPWENVSQVRHMGSSDDRDAHREERMNQRHERLLSAVERGCITEEEMNERMTQRKGRFSNK